MNARPDSAYAREEMDVSAIMKSWKRWLVGAVVLTGTGVGAEPPPTNSAQGTRLHGSERFEFVNVPLTTVEAPSPVGSKCTSGLASVAGGRLLVTQSCTPDGGGIVLKRFVEGPALKGTSFRAPFEGRSVKLTVAEVRCHEDITLPTSACTAENVQAGKARWEYRVIASPADKQEIALCPTGSGYALAVPNAWSTSGDLLTNHDYFTFACAPRDEGVSGKPFFVGGGVIAKCIDWGYAPWAGATSTSDTIAREYHQLCTRMAVADYCGEGRSNTLDGTPLAFMGPEHAAAISPLGKLPSTLAPDGYALEAVWTMDACGLARPVCLGKKRWDSLAAEGTCLDASLHIPETKVTCEMLNLSNLGDRVLVSYSPFIDHALVTFRRGTTEYITTTAVEGNPGESAGGTALGGFELAPGLGGQDPDSFEPLRVEGPILSATLSTDLKQRMGTFIKPLYRCVTSTGRNLLTDSKDCDLVPGYTLKSIAGDQGLEGFVYSSVDTTSSGQRRPLKLWRHSTTGVFATSTEAPSGFTFVRDLGYLPAVGQLPGRDL
ncbi:ADYC domain-containing protein [Corallococcus llansteffanensis]|uniref:ADYC domain-containing protein n=1 Tax=Corallococcus llansteffanensis TaxID=2316731 RepID=A0A3A8PAQ7_9BACT|nr:ADYC domain-containing protein [Corallococcus llansteffanensis]RKH48784.1 hypothetical protein D7V93_32765 [Corallococcus llansteffanensis]